MPRGAIQSDEVGGSEPGSSGGYSDSSQQCHLPTTDFTQSCAVSCREEQVPGVSIYCPGNGKPGPSLGRTNEAFLRTDRNREGDSGESIRGEYYFGASSFTATSLLFLAGRAELLENADRF